MTRVPVQCYDLDFTGGLMEKIQQLIAPPFSEEGARMERRKKAAEREMWRRRCNHETCDACGEGGDLLCCDCCPAAFHLQCCNPPLVEDKVPTGEWACHCCVVSGNVKTKDGHHRHTLTKAAMDLLKQHETEYGQLPAPFSPCLNKSSDLLGIHPVKQHTLKRMNCVMPATNSKDATNSSNETAIQNSTKENITHGRRKSNQGQNSTQLPKNSAKVDYRRSSEPAVPPLSSFDKDWRKNVIKATTRGQKAILESGNGCNNREIDLSNPFAALIAAACMENTHLFNLPEEFKLNTPLPGTKKMRNNDRNNRQRRISTHELDSNGLVSLPASLCFICSKSCRVAPLIKCDFCSLSFHADCLDPPLTNIPTGRWMCPNHAEKNLLDSRKALSERTRVYHLYRGKLDQTNIKIDFLKKAHRTFPPKPKYTAARKVTTRVPMSIKGHYNDPLTPPPPPTSDDLRRLGLELPYDFRVADRVKNSAELSENAATHDEQALWLESVSKFLVDVALKMQAAPPQHAQTHDSSITQSEVKMEVEDTLSEPYFENCKFKPRTLKRIAENACSASGLRIIKKEKIDKETHSAGVINSTGVVPSPLKRCSSDTALSSSKGDRAPFFNETDAPGHVRRSVSSDNEIVNGDFDSLLSRISAFPHRSVSMSEDSHRQAHDMFSSISTCIRNGKSSESGGCDAVTMNGVMEERSESLAPVMNDDVEMSTVDYPNMNSSTSSMSDFSRSDDLPKRDLMDQNSTTNNTEKSETQLLENALKMLSQRLTNESNSNLIDSMDSNLIKLLAHQRIKQLMDMKTDPVPIQTKSVKNTQDSKISTTAFDPLHQNHKINEDIEIGNNFRDENCNVDVKTCSEQVMPTRAVFYHTESGKRAKVYYKSFTIGRSSQCDMVLSDIQHCAFVSDKHASIFYDKLTDRYELLACGETIVDGIKYGRDVAGGRGSRRAKRNKSQGSELTKAVKNSLRNKQQVKLNFANAALRKEDIGVMASKPTVTSVEEVKCRCSSAGQKPNLGGWEGTAVLHHGSVVRMGCIEFVFCLPDFSASSNKLKRKEAFRDDWFGYDRMWFKTSELVHRSRKISEMMRDADEAYKFQENGDEDSLADHLRPKRSCRKARSDKKRRSSSTSSRRKPSHPEEDADGKKRSSAKARKTEKQQKQFAIIKRPATPTNQQEAPSSRTAAISPTNVPQTDASPVQSTVEESNPYDETMDDDMKPTRFSQRQKERQARRTTKKHVTSDPEDELSDDSDNSSPVHRDASPHQRHHSGERTTPVRGCSPITSSSSVINAAMARKNDFNTITNRQFSKPFGKTLLKAKYRRQKAESAAKSRRHDGKFSPRRSGGTNGVAKGAVAKKLPPKTHQTLDFGMARLSETQNLALLGTVGSDEAKPGGRANATRLSSIDLTCNETLSSDDVDHASSDRAIGDDAVLVNGKADYHEPFTPRLANVSCGENHVTSPADDVSTLVYDVIRSIADTSDVSFRSLNGSLTGSDVHSLKRSEKVDDRQEKFQIATDHVQNSTPINDNVAD